MRRLALLSLATLLAGCSAPDDLPPVSVPDELPPADCSNQPPPLQQETTVGPGARYIHTPTGGAMWGGNAIHLPFSDDPQRLIRLQVHAEWDDHPANVDLRLGIRDPNARSPAEHWAYGPANGGSPLDLDIASPERGRLGPDLHIDVGTSQNATFPLPGTIALLPQTVRLRVQETYLCPGAETLL